MPSSLQRNQFVHSKLIDFKDINGVVMVLMEEEKNGSERER